MRIRFCKCDRQRCKYVVVRPDWVQSNLCFTVGSPRNYNSLGGKSLHHPPLETSQRSLLHLQMTSTPDSHDQILHNRAVCEVRRALKVGKHPHNVATQTSMSDKTHVFVSVPIWVSVREMGCFDSGETYILDQKAQDPTLLGRDIC